MLLKTTMLVLGELNQRKHQTNIHGPILTFGQKSREHNEQLRRYWQTEYPESAEVLSSPEIMENTVDSHSEKNMQVNKR